MTCPHCHETIQNDWYFCRWCGAALAASVAASVKASASLRDVFLNALLAGAQAQQTQQQQSSNYQPGEAALTAANRAGVASTLFPNL